MTGAVSHDAAGNLTSWNANMYQYDRFHQMTRMAAASGSQTWLSMYDANDERVFRKIDELAKRAKVKV